MKAFVLMRKGYEYNDEIYNETEGGTPKKIFFSEKDAKEHLIELNIKEIKESGIESYAYDIEDIVNNVDKLKDFVSKLNEKYGKNESTNRWYDLGDYALNKKATLEEGKEYLKLINLRFYELVPVEVDVPSTRDHRIDQILTES